MNKDGMSSAASRATAACLVEGGVVITPDEVIPDGVVAIVGERIGFVGRRSDFEVLEAAWLQEQAASLTRVDAKGRYVVPGYVDVHIHGGGGKDALDATPEAIRTVARTHGRHGTTSFLVTTATSSPDNLLEAARATVAVMRQQTEATAQESRQEADVIGMHLEGPYLSGARKGAQNEAFLRDMDPAELERLLEVLGPAFRMMTVAPERPHGLEAIRWLVEHGVVASIGHTQATYEQAKAAVALGAQHATHTYNAMTGLHHRDPGTVGAVTTSPGVVCELIADGIHVHPGAMRVLYELKGARRLALVTDAVAGMGMPEGEYQLAGKQVFLRDGAVRLADGTLAGSALSMEKAVANMVSRVGVPLPEAIRMATLTPAESVGVQDRKGSLAVGKDADLLLLSSDLTVERSMVRGQWLVWDE
ncbi:MAG: N-acetylglucosamine-6-phosphate deacetylase [Limnochordaceae bacterium]|nr:N-acetylglucosamine-6-phosphate deacetylase [Limnochordaceae bacterium]